MTTEVQAEIDAQDDREYHKFMSSMRAWLSRPERIEVTPRLFMAKRVDPFGGRNPVDRVNELLASNNALLERARTAERTCKVLQEQCARLMFALAQKAMEARSN